MAKATSAAPGVCDDIELMRLIASGHIPAFEELYDRYSDRAYRVALSVCRDGGRAEDAVQETFISIWANRTMYVAERGSVAAWLLSSARYRSIDVARRHTTDTTHQASAELIELKPAAGDVAEQVFARDDAARLRLLLTRIPDSQREIITLAFYGQLTHTEIAAHLQLPAGTVKGRMRLGLQKLRASVGEAAA